MSPSLPPLVPVHFWCSVPVACVSPMFYYLLYFWIWFTFSLLTLAFVSVFVVVYNLEHISLDVVSHSHWSTCWLQGWTVDRMVWFSILKEETLLCSDEKLIRIRLNPSQNLTENKMSFAFETWWQNPWQCDRRQGYKIRALTCKPITISCSGRWEWQSCADKYACDSNFWTGSGFQKTHPRNPRSIYLGELDSHVRLRSVPQSTCLCDHSCCLVYVEPLWPAGWKNQSINTLFSMWGDTQQCSDWENNNIKKKTTRSVYICQSVLIYSSLLCTVDVGSLPVSSIHPRRINLPWGKKIK